MRPVAEGLFQVSGQDVSLIGARRRSDGAVTFPFPVGSETEDYEKILLPTTGTLWTYTVQRFRPKAPYNDGLAEQAEFKPYAVGYVHLDGHVIVETRIVTEDLSVLKLGLPMKVVLEKLRTEADGEEILTYAFSPLRENAHASPSRKA